MPTRLRAERRRRGWSQTRLARVMGCDPSAVSLWESGRRRRVWPRTAEKMEALFGLPVSALLEMEDDTRQSAALLPTASAAPARGDDV